MCRTIAIILSSFLLGCISRESFYDYSVIPAAERSESESMTYFIDGVFDNQKVVASVTMRQFSETDTSLSGVGWYGTDGGLPVLVISKINMSVGEHSIRIPPAVYARHGDSFFQGSPLSLQARGDELVLRFGGSDGAGAYFLDIVTSRSEFLRARTFTHDPNLGSWN